MAREVAQHRTARLDRLIHGEVRSGHPKTRRLIPFRRSRHAQHDSHKDEREYRFAFGTRSNVFDFEHVLGLMVPPGYVFPRIELQPQAHRLKLFLGNLNDCCRLRE